MTRAAAVLFGLLAGCAVWPLDQADCTGVDWRERGYADGFGGHPQQYLRLEHECRRRFGVEVSETEYFKGWNDGHEEWYRVIGSLQHKR